jgi:hypothetical protein
MNTKLTLRMDDELVRQAKAEAARRGKSVSQMVGEFIDSLSAARRDAARGEEDLPPVTASLIGVLKGRYQRCPGCPVSAHSLCQTSGQCIRLG